MFISKLVAFTPLLTLVIALPTQHHETHSWHPPRPGDRRGPCPMVNALANHGYLPRDGLNVSMDTLIEGLTEAVNLHPVATRLVGTKALEASTTGYNNTFHLDDINKHGVIEHDGSLSRQDFALGDNANFDPEIWATVVSHFNKPFIDVPTAAKARLARLAAAEASNPDFSLSPAGIRISLIETAIYVAMFSDGIDQARTEWVRVVFEQERIPFREGFKRRDQPLTDTEILDMVAKVVAAGS